MIIEFTVGNFLSFKEPKTLSLEATRVTEYQDSTFKVNHYHLLKSAVIYGANSSGKSNLIKALAIMRNIVLTSVERSSAYKYNITPFLLSTSTEKAPSLFEVVFLLKDSCYRYGFTIDREAVHEEWLFQKKDKQELVLFVRDKEGIGVSDIFEEGNGLEAKTRENTLFLSVVDQFNGSIATQVIKWFNSCSTISGLEHEEYRFATYDLLQQESHKELLTNFFSTLDLGFEQININKTNFFPESIREAIGDIDESETVEVTTVHKQYDDNGKVVNSKVFDLRTLESSGTNKLIDLSGAIFYALTEGRILVIDELDAKLHPLLTTAITNLFNSKEHNPQNAQLIFATHDTNLLSYGQFRRDQIYFVEKDQYEASDLYSLIEYREGDSNKPVRKDRSFEKDYIQGRYGAIPFIGDFKMVLGNGKV